MEESLKDKVNKLLDECSSLKDEKDYYVELANNISSSGKDEEYMCSLFDSVLKDLHDGKLPKDLDTLREYVNNDDLLVKTIIQHLDIDTIKDTLSNDYSGVYEQLRKLLPKA